VKKIKAKTVIALHFRGQKSPLSYLLSWRWYARNFYWHDINRFSYL